MRGFYNLSAGSVFLISFHIQVFFSARCSTFQSTVSHLMEKEKGYTEVPHNISSLSIHINLSFNVITYVLSGIFSSLEQCLTLNLASNRISRIETRTFTGLTNLQKLYLGSNQISVIEEGTFMSLTNLQHLNLRHNQISVLSDGTFSGLSN